MAIETESYFVSWPVLNMETRRVPGPRQTYPPHLPTQVESNFDHHELVRLIGRLGARGCICRELHRNGGVHYHALLVFDSAYHTGTRIALMSEELTPISNQYDGLLEEHTNTCRRMVTSSSTISRTTILTGLEHLHQLIGLTSSLHQTKQLFF